ncbi:MAG: UDP binding domain-containing protein [Ferruginibacter sp.]
MGVTFKENVSDVRNSKVADLVKELKSFSLNVDVTDPYASNEALKRAYGFELKPVIEDNYDAVIITVPHEEFKKLDDNYFAGITKNTALIADLKGIYRSKIKSRAYWSL